MDSSTLIGNCRLVPCDEFHIKRNYVNTLTLSIQSANVEYSVMLGREQLAQVHQEIGKFLHSTEEKY